MHCYEESGRDHERRVLGKDVLTQGGLGPECHCYGLHSLQAEGALGQ